MANVAVFGLGNLGLPMAALYANAGHQVKGIDINEDLIDDLNDHNCSSPEPGLCELLEHAWGNLSFYATSDLTSYTLQDCEFLIIIVPTPSGEDGAFKNDYVENVLEQLSFYLHGTNTDHIVVVASTVMPKSCDQFQKDYIDPFNTRNKGNLSLAYSPEFIALGNVIKGLQSPDLILIGTEKATISNEVGWLIASVLDIDHLPDSPQCTLVEAEITKLALNNYLSIKTAFANSIGELSQALGADPSVVLDAVGSDSRIGKKFLRPGMPSSGPCIPRDTTALRKLSWDQNIPPFLSRSAEMIHDRRKAYLLNLAESSGGPYAIVGLTYKPDTPIVDASPTVWLSEKLLAYYPNRPIKTWDPLAPSTSATLEEALIGAQTIILGDVNHEIHNKVYKYYQDNDVRLLDCWTA